MLERWPVSVPIATFHHAQFSDLSALAESKRRQGLSVSLCIPCYNEEDTIGEVVAILRRTLVEEIPLIDEIAVVDSGSSDRSREAAVAAGGGFYPASDILPHLPAARGKGENVWKAVYQLRGDILCFVDGDVRNMHGRFVYGPLGALLQNPALHYVKAFYDRPHATAGAGNRPAGGGRVTEALVRPLFSLFYPELAGLVQPLAGEYAVRRSVLERLSMPTGYGIETAHLLDVCETWGASALGQCDLEERLHRHQDTAALGRMSFAILQTFFGRLKRAGRLPASWDLPSVYRHFVREAGVCRAVEWHCADIERPPLASLEDYRRKFGTAG